MTSTTPLSPQDVKATDKGSIRWGILGAGRIAQRFAQSLSHEPHSRLVAISCRKAQKARDFAAKFGVSVDRAYSDEVLGAPAAAHERLLEDPDIDAVYISLPHGLHYEWTLAALRAGKAVLCEKPAMLSTAQMEVVADVAWDRKLLFMEAQKERFVPVYQEVKELLAKGAVGDVLTVETSLCNNMPERLADKNDYLRDPIAGGVLFDCGCYCASWLEDLLVGEPEIKKLDVEFEHGVDVRVDCELRFGRTFGWLECAANERKPRQVHIIGNAGRIVVDELHRSQHVLVYGDGDRPFAVNAPYVVDDFYGEIEHFVGLLLAGEKESPIMTMGSSLRCAYIIDLIRSAFPMDLG